MKDENEDEKKKHDQNDQTFEELEAVPMSQRDASRKTTETLRLLPSKTCPQSTPATRLPLADLVSNSEDASKHATARNNSPGERMYWRNLQCDPFTPSKQRLHIDLKDVFA
ncbi:hypothetical protein BU16DRAFT_559046 [Lophium mytilinum]|uniref:Uncharacterized protein n=1 Tax=Lophium mytilinum TaxID=390894 RepID=A0A6A6QXV7_9PEZI|nr:hypothetical protein BU16DRAFT_559046 [Lophium mytilinum]